MNISTLRVDTPSLDQMAVRQWLDAWAELPGYLHICHTGSWTGQAFSTDPEGLDAATDFVVAIDYAQPLGIYARPTTVRDPLTPGKRGSEHDSACLPFLWLDIDIAGPGHRTDGPLPADEDAARKIVDASGLPEPTAWAHSGGGMYPVWKITDAETVADVAAMRELSTRWHAIAEEAADRLGLECKPTADLARVLRIPGTVNRKEGLERPCRVVSDDGEQYRFAELVEIARSIPLDVPAPLTPAERADVTAWQSDGSTGPLDAFAAAATWADVLEPAGWAYVGTDPTGDRWRRPGDAASDYSARAMHDAGCLFVHSTSAGLPVNTGLTKGRVFAELHHGGDRVAACRDLLDAARGDPSTLAAARQPRHVLSAIDATTTGPLVIPPELVAAFGAMFPGVAPADDREPSAWGRIDLASVLAGDYSPAVPTILDRGDGVRLFYPGLLHWLYGESESGKSWIALYAAAEVMRDGGHVLYLDFEEDAASIVSRFRAIGIADAVIGRQLDYRRPDGTYQNAEFAALLGARYDYAVIDGVTDALGMEAASINDNDEVAAWIRAVPRRIADKTGACVVCVDHVVKSNDTKSRFAIGSQHKMSSVNGAAYIAEPEEVLGRGRRGVVLLKIAKDRPGQIRAHCGKAEKNRTQHAARVVVDSTSPDRTVIEMQPHDVATGKFAVLDGARNYEPTCSQLRMVSAYVRGCPNGATKSDVVANGGAGARTLRLAVDRLAEGGWFDRRGNRYVSMHHYRETDEDEES